MTLVKDKMIKKNKGFTPLLTTIKLKSVTGFTLLELQVASFVSFITLLAILSLYIFSWRSFNTGDTLLDVYSNSRAVIGWMTKDIRCARQVVLNVEIAGSPGTYYTTTDNSIVLDSSLEIKSR